MRNNVSTFREIKNEMHVAIGFRCIWRKWLECSVSDRDYVVIRSGTAVAEQRSRNEMKSLSLHSQRQWVILPSRNIYLFNSYNNMLRASHYLRCFCFSVLPRGRGTFHCHIDDTPKSVCSSFACLNARWQQTSMPSATPLVSPAKISRSWIPVSAWCAVRFI